MRTVKYLSRGYMNNSDEKILEGERLFNLLFELEWKRIITTNESARALKRLKNKYQFVQKKIAYQFNKIHTERDLKQ